MPRPFTPKIITANDLLEGDVIYYTADNSWTREMSQAELIEDDEDETLSYAQRGGFEAEARKFADNQGYSVDWDSVERLDDMSLINGVSQIAPFDPASKQALLEASGVSERAHTLIALLDMDMPGDDSSTLQ